MDYTPLIWQTLRDLSIYAPRYTRNYKQVMHGLFALVPWNKWPKGGKLYGACLAILHGSEARKKWASKFDCPEDVSGEYGWEVVASWASADRL